MVVYEELAVFLEPDGDFERHFIGLGPTAQEEVGVEIGRDCIADDDGIVGDSVVDAFNLAGAELDII